MPWKPGESGNPGGRPRHPAIKEAQEIARKRLAVGVVRLAVIARRGDAKDSIAATRLLAQIAGVPLTPDASTQPDTQPPAPSPGIPMTAEMLREELRKQAGSMEQ